MGTTPLESKETSNSTTTSPVGISFNYSALELAFQLNENLFLKSINFVVSEFAISNGGKLKIYYLRLFLVLSLTTRHAVAQMVSCQFSSRFPGSIPAVWDLWWTTWHWERFLSEYFSLLQSEIFQQFSYLFLICHLDYIISGFTASVHDNFFMV
jgi:hypothetical protein